MLSDIIPDIYTYSIIVSFSSFIVYFTANLRNKNIPMWHLLLSSCAIVLATMIGGRVMWILENINDIDIRDVFYLGFGSWRLLGAILFAMATMMIIAYIYKKFYNISVKNVLDISLEGAFLALFFIKFSCLLEGCCYGIETTLPWGMKFKDGLIRHPTQIYESFALFLIFIIIRLLRNKLSTSKRYSIAIILYIVSRMLIEPLREEADIFINGPTRIIYYLLLVVCLLILFKDQLYGFYTSKLKDFKK